MAPRPSVDVFVVVTVATRTGPPTPVGAISTRGQRRRRSRPCSLRSKAAKDNAMTRGRTGPAQLIVGANVGALNGRPYDATEREVEKSDSTFTAQAENAKGSRLATPWRNWRRL